MPASVFHVLSATTPDNTSYEIRPSHWNSSHIFTLNAVGSEISGAFSNANGVSFGLSGTAVTASHNGLTTAALSDHSHGNPQLNLTNLGGTTASASNGLTLSLSAAAQTVQPVAFSAGAASSLFSTLVFQDSNGVSFSNNAGSIRASHNGLTSQSNQNVTAANGGFAFQTLSFSNLNGISFGTSAGSAITASHNGLTTAALSDHSHGNPQLNLTNLSGTTASNSGGFTLSLSAAAAGAAVINFSAGTTSGDIGSVVFSNLNGVSFGLNGSTITGSVNAGGGGVTYSGFNPFGGMELVTHAGANGSLYIKHLEAPAIQFDNVGIWITHANTSNSSGSATLSAHIGIYTRNVSTLSLLSSTSFTTAITQSGTVGSYSNYAGIKILRVPWTNTLPAGNYWVGRLTRSTTGGANMTFGGMAVSQVASTWSGYFGSGSHATAHRWIGQGVYSATLSTLPGSIALTQVNANSSIFHRQPCYAFLSGVF